MTAAYINQIKRAVPQYDIHQQFLNYAPSLLKDTRQRKLFERMAARTQIDHRYSFFKPGQSADSLDDEGFYHRGQFPTTAPRMQFYQTHAFELVKQACDQFDGATLRKAITHIIVVSCTGFYAPGIDTQIVNYYGLKPTVERSVISFMGCSAAFNGMKLAQYIVRAVPEATVLLVNIELCTLHLQETENLEELLSFLIFADGCAASIISAQPLGLQLQTFHTVLLPASDLQLTWQIGQYGFDMVLSGQVPLTIAATLPNELPAILGDVPMANINHWAVHPGGRSILDAVQAACGLANAAMLPSRAVLRQYGNMSSATIMFVLQAIMAAEQPGAGCALAFGPGITLESMRFDYDGI